MVHRFQDRAVLVTGGAHGIGRATADRLRAEGAVVTVADLDEVAEQTDLTSVRCDVTDRASVDAAVASAVRRWGRLDAVVAVAGGARPEPPLGGWDDADWTSEIDLNLTSAMRCTRAALPHLGRGGSLTFVASVNGLTALGGEPYSAAKAGLVSLARNLAVQLGPRGVRVNVVAPGTVRTRVWDHQGGADRLTALYPLGRVGEPADIAAAVAFLASDDASWITGVTLPVEGGLLAGPAQTLGRLLDG